MQASIIGPGVMHRRVKMPEHVERECFNVHSKRPQMKAWLAVVAPGWVRCRVVYKGNALVDMQRSGAEQ